MERWRIWTECFDILGLDWGKYGVSCMLVRDRRMECGSVQGKGDVKKCVVLREAWWAG